MDRYKFKPVHIRHHREQLKVGVQFHSPSQFSDHPVTQGSGEGRSSESFVRGIGGSEGPYAGASEGTLSGTIFPHVRGK